MGKGTYKKAVYCYSIKDPSLYFESDSIVGICKDLWGHWKQKYSIGINYSLRSDRLHKNSYKEYIFFYKENGCDVLKPNEINLAIWNRDKHMNFNNRFSDRINKMKQLRKRAVRATHPLTGESYEYDTIIEAAESFYGNHSNIIRAIKCDGTAYGWKFEYIDNKYLSKSRTRPYRIKINHG